MYIYRFALMEYTWWYSAMLMLFCCCVQDEIGLKEWLLSLRAAHKNSLELLANMARKAGKIYGTDRDTNSRPTFQNSPVASRSANGN